MNLHNQLLLHIAKGLIAHCRVFIQYSQAIDDLDTILKALEHGMDYGITDEALSKLMDQAHDIQVALRARDEIYLAANTVGNLAYSLILKAPEKSKNALNRVMAQITVVLGLEL